MASTWGLWAEPGFARAQPAIGWTTRGVKEGAHEGTLGSPVR
jgi:hypothetical protein